MRAGHAPFHAKGVKVPGRFTLMVNCRIPNDFPDLQMEVIVGNEDGNIVTQRVGTAMQRSKWRGIDMVISCFQVTSNLSWMPG